MIAGIPDLRRKSDRYLSLAEDRAKARRLADLAAQTDLTGLASSYYEMTDDVDALRASRFLAHIDGAENRGAALARLLPGSGRILEVGCGTGGLLAAAARTGKTIIGIDIASRWLIAARRRLDDRGLSVPLLAASADDLPWPDESFDAVVADSLLEHVDDSRAVLAELARVLRPGGRLVLWSPNRRSILPDPHVGLLGVGWLPRAWAKAYVRWRRGCEWTVRPLAAREAVGLLAKEDWCDVRADSAEHSGRVFVGRVESSSDVARGGARKLDPPYKDRSLLLRVYGLGSRLPLLGSFLREYGPLWQVTARKRGES